MRCGAKSLWIMAPLLLTHAAPSAAQHPVKHGALACLFLYELDRSETIRESGDAVAYKRHLSAVLSSRVCIWLRPKQIVFVERIFGRGYAQVRIVGQFQSLFTMSRAVD